ncbi:hypothetical protein QJQ45_014476, partial [Haematococcus lacustris]
MSAPGLLPAHAVLLLQRLAVLDPFHHTYSTPGEQQRQHSRQQRQPSLPQGPQGPHQVQEVTLTGALHLGSLQQPGSCSSSPSSATPAGQLGRLPLPASDPAPASTPGSAPAPALTPAPASAPALNLASPPQDHDLTPASDPALPLTPRCHGLTPAWDTASSWPRPQPPLASAALAAAVPHPDRPGAVRGQSAREGLRSAGLLSPPSRAAALTLTRPVRVRATPEQPAPKAVLALEAALAGPAAPAALAAAVQPATGAWAREPAGRWALGAEQPRASALQGQQQGHGLQEGQGRARGQGQGGSCQQAQGQGQGRGQWATYQQGRGQGQGQGPMPGPGGVRHPGHGSGSHSGGLGEPGHGPQGQSQGQGFHSTPAPSPTPPPSPLPPPPPSQAPVALDSQAELHDDDTTPTHSPPPAPPPPPSLAAVALDSQAELERRLVAAALAGLPQLLPVEVVELVATLPRLQDKEARHTSAMRAAQHLLVSGGMPSLVPHHVRALANAASSLARCEVDPGAAWISHFLQVTRLAMPSFCAVDLAAIAWALAKWGFQPAPFWLEAFYARLQEVSSQLSCQGMCNVVWAMAVLQLQPPSQLLETLMFEAQ